MTCDCDPGFKGQRCETSKCEINCSLHGGVPNSACTQCVGCKGAWTGATDEGLVFYALGSSIQNSPVNLYLCDTDHIYSPTPSGPNMLFQNQSLPTYKMMVAKAGPYVAQVENTGHLRVYKSIPAKSSVVWDSGNPQASASDKNYTLEMRDDGRLTVTSAEGTIVWNSSSTPLEIGDYFVELQDDGILTIWKGNRDDIEGIVWQSTRGNVSSPCTLEGVQFNAALPNTTGAVPVYEFYNPTTNDHAYRAVKQ